MAELRITVGQLTAFRTASNAKATELLSDYAAAIGAQGTDQERLQAVVNGLVIHMQQEAQRQRRNVETAQRMAEIQATIDGLTWT